MIGLVYPETFSHRTRTTSRGSHLGRPKPLSEILKQISNAAALQGQTHGGSD